MAKRGVKNIPLAVDDEDSIKLIEAEFGLKGWATVIKLLQFIGEHGYYVKMDIDTQLLFIRDKCLTAVGRSAVSEIIECAVRRGVFDAEMYQKHGILTNSRLQETFLNTYKRSKEIVFDKNYALPIVYKFIENVSKNDKSVNIFLKNADTFTTNKIRQDKIRLDNSSSIEIAKDDYSELCSTIGKSDTDYYLERVKAFLKKKPDASFDVKATILKWHREDKKGELKSEKSGSGATGSCRWLDDVPKGVSLGELYNKMADNLSEDEL